VKIRLYLRHEDDSIGAFDTQAVETEGERFVLVKFPIPDGMSLNEVTRYLQSQAGVIREFLGEQPFVIVPMYPGWVCELGVINPDLEDLKECISILPAAERREFLIEMGVEHLKTDPPDDDDDDWGHIGNST